MNPAVCRVALVTLGFGLLFGFSTAIVAGVLDGIVDGFHLTTRQAELTVASLVGSCFVGAITAGPLSARIGRRGSLVIAASLATAGYALVAFDGHFAALVAARLLIGAGVGLSSMVAPMYAGEASPERLRGAVVSVFQLAVTLGMLIAYAVPLVLGALDWQRVISSGLTVSVFCLATLLFVPESPRWLALRGRGPEAGRAAGLLQLDLPPVAAGAPPARTGESAGGSTLAVLVLCSGLFVLQNLSGIDGVLYYAPRIFTELGLPAGTAALSATLGLGVVNVIATVVAMAYVDRAGRRRLLNVGCALMVFGMGTTAAADIIAAPVLGLIGLGVFIAAFAVSLGPLPYVLMSELFPAEIRERGIALASATSWLFNALVAGTFLTGIELIGLSGVLMLFAAVCLIALLLGMRFVPETRGVSLEAIEAKVTAGVPLRWVGHAPEKAAPALAAGNAE